MLRRFKGPFHTAMRTNGLEYELSLQQCSHLWLMPDSQPPVCDAPCEPEQNLDESHTECHAIEPTCPVEDNCQPTIAICREMIEEPVQMTGEPILIDEQSLPAQNATLTPPLTLSLRKKISMFDVVKQAKRQSFREKIDAIREL